MMEERERPVVVAVHQKLKDELEKRREILEIDRRINGGLTTISEIAAFELEGIRKSREDLNFEISKFRKPKIFSFEINGTEDKFVLLETYKGLFQLASIINKKKDKKQLNIDFSKLKGMKKNQVDVSW